MTFDREAFSDFLVHEGVIGFFNEPLTLKTNKQTHWYVSGRALAQHAHRLSKTAEFVFAFINDEPSLKKLFALDTKPTHGIAFLGVPEGATLLGNEIQRTAIAEGMIEDKLYQIRVKPKEHGAPISRHWVTDQIPERVIIVEDTSTTGSSSLALCERLRALDIEVVANITLINRLQLDASGKSVAENMQAHDLPCHSLTDASLVLPKALARLDDARREHIRATIMEEYKAEYGDRPLPFIL